MNFFLRWALTYLRITRHLWNLTGGTILVPRSDSLEGGFTKIILVSSLLVRSVFWTAIRVVGIIVVDVFSIGIIGVALIVETNEFLFFLEHQQFIRSLSAIIFYDNDAATRYQGLNTGVVLYNLARMRESKQWQNYLEKVLFKSFTIPPQYSWPTLVWPNSRGLFLGHLLVSAPEPEWAPRML